MAVVTLQGHIDIPASELAVVAAELAEHIILTRKEPGCLKFEVTPDPSVTGRFKVFEQFSSQDAFDAHQERIKQSHWGNVSGRVSRHYDVIIEESQEA